MQQDQRASRQGARSADRIFEIGKYWLGLERHSTTYYCYWYDANARRTRRETTGIRDLDEAKTWLVKLHLKEAPDKPHKSADDVTIASVKAFYFEHHARHIRSCDAADRAFHLILKFIRSQKEGAPKVGDFTLAAQESFMRWAAATGLTAKSIASYLLYYRAAVRFGAKPRMIHDGRGAEREARLYELAPYVEASEKAVARVVGGTMSRPRSFVPSEADLAKMLDAIVEPHVRRYCIMALNLWARPEAITELRVKAQVDFERGLVHLNPPDRRQNNKVRPTVRLTDNLRGWLIYWNVDAPICRTTRDGRDVIVRKIDNRSLKRAAERAGLPDADLYTRYVFRHFMATKVRAVAGIPVSREQRAEWMGHADPDHRTTQLWYESMDPDHLLDACRATDAIMLRLHHLCARGLVAPTVRAGTRLQLVENAAPIRVNGKSRA